MACIMNGIALHGGVFCGCATFFVFSDYMKPAIRIAALQEIPVKFIYSHDSFRVGEDGPTHEPIEQEAQLRLMEQVHNLSGRRSLMVIRPADSAETVAAYKMAMENKETPTALILSRQNLEDLPGENRREEAMKAVNGGYVVVKAENPDVVLVGNGSDVALLVHAAEELAKEGIKAQVASVPAIGVFLDQPQEYRESVIPTGVKKFGLTSGLPINLYPLMTGDFEVVGMERFGASAPAKVLEEHFGYTTAAVTARIRDFLTR
jgi:transketolase